MPNHNKSALFYDNIENLLESIQQDFSEVVKIKTIGFTSRNNPIKMAVLDARSFLISQVEKNSKLKLHSKPAIVLNGQHHAREVLTSSLVLFSLLDLIHGGIVHRKKHEFNLLIQNKYYFIPTINVDGLKYI